jgi:hypothetical protein
MSLFQEWKAQLWQEFWAVRLPGAWRERVKLVAPVVGSALCGVSLAAGLLKWFPNRHDCIGAGFGVISIGTMVYAYVDYWNRFKRIKIAERCIALNALCDDFLGEWVSVQEFLKQASNLLESRFGKDSVLGLIHLYTILMNHPSPILADKLFDPLFEDQDPRVVSESIHTTFDPTASIPLGVQIRHKEFLAKRASHCAVYKEELMAAAWHPKRVESWIRQDRWDLLE